MELIVNKVRFRRFLARIKALNKRFKLTVEYF